MVGPILSTGLPELSPPDCQPNQQICVDLHYNHTIGCNYLSKPLLSSFQSLIRQSMDRPESVEVRRFRCKKWTIVGICLILMASTFIGGVAGEYGINYGIDYELTNLVSLISTNCVSIL